MTAFEKWNDRYKKHWCTKRQLRILVDLTILTKTDYEEITGEPYAK